MYALIKGGGLFMGIFSSKKRMKEFIDGWIQLMYEKDGYYGNFAFQYAKVTVDAVWAAAEDRLTGEESAMDSLFTMHSERFIHKIKTDWSTGEVLDMDANETTNVNEK